MTLEYFQLNQIWSFLVFFLVNKKWKVLFKSPFKIVFSVNHCTSRNYVLSVFYIFIKN